MGRGPNEKKASEKAQPAKQTQEVLKKLQPILSGRGERGLGVKLTSSTR